MMVGRSGRVDLGAVNAQLLARVDDFMRHLAIDGHRARGGRTWEGGDRGARVTVTLTGSVAGAWGAWSQNAKGWGLVSLLAWRRGIEFGPAIGEALAFLGGTPAASPMEPIATGAARAAHDDSGRVRHAQRLARRFRSIGGTVGERYLEQRGICRPAAGWPAAVGFDPVDQALAATVLDPAGTVVAVHRIFLTPDGRKIGQAEAETRELRAVKQTFGPRSRGALVLGRPANGRIVVAEGLETALAIYAATGECVLAALGTIGSLKALPSGVTAVVFAMEDDADGSVAAVASQATVRRFADSGVKVSIAWPWPTRRGDKTDLADTIRDAGVQAVRDQFAAAERVYGARGAPISDARTIMAAGVTRWLAGSGPKHLLLTGEPGTGKSHLAHRLPLADIARRKAAGEPHRLLVLVPDHQLAGESLTRLRAAVEANAAGLKVATLLGFGDVDKPVTPASPCQNLPAVALALSVGQSPSQAVCGPSAHGDRCAHWAGCKRLASVAAAKEADVVIAAHGYAFEAGYLPQDICTGLARVVIDEDLVTGAIYTSRVGLETFSPLHLARAPVLVDGATDPKGTAELDALQARLITAVNAAPDGYLSAQAVRDAKLTVDDVHRARALSWDRKRVVAMHPGMPLEDRRRATAGARINGQLGRIAALWHALEDLLTRGEASAGRIRVELETTRDRGQVRTLIVTGLRKLAPWLTEVPVLLLDGTADVDRVRRLLPAVERLTVPKVATPHVRLHLVTGGFGASAMASPERQADLLRFMTARTGFGEAALLVTHKSAADGFTNAGFDLAVRHHGAVAGSDSYRKVRGLFVTSGRSLPPEAAAELAAAMTGEAVPIAGRVRISEPVKLRDGRTVMVERMAYADPRTQAGHDAVMFTDIAQAVGRGRGILRTTDTPLDVYVFGTAAPSGMTFDTVQSWADVRPDCLDEMMQAGLVPESPTHAAALHPRLFTSVKAAEQRIRRAVERSRRRLNLPVGMTTAEVIHKRVELQAATWGQHWTFDRYQRSGQGHAPTTVHAPVAALMVTRKVVAATLGPVTWSKSSAEVVPCALRESFQETETTSPLNAVASSSAIVWRAPPRAFRVDRPPDG